MSTTIPGPESPVDEKAVQFAPPVLDLEGVVGQFRPLADWWASRIQWSEDDHEDLVQEGLLELIKTLEGYNRSGRPIQDLKAVASICFSASMKWWYKKIDRNLTWVSYEDLSSTPVDPTDEFFTKIYIDNFLAALESVHGPVCRLIVVNLLDPSAEVAARALQEMEAKRRLKAAGHRVIGYASPRITKQHVREALSLDTNEWDHAMTVIKTFTQEYVCRNPSGRETGRFQCAPAKSRAN